jgi:SSS family transporter
MERATGDMTHFGWPDWLVIALYLAGIMGLGVWFGKDQKTTRDYFLGSRTTPWWGIGLSIVAAETSALTIIGVPAMAYGDNLGFIQMVLGYVIARLILAWIMVPHYFSGEIYSPYQLFANAFGPGARQTAGGLFLLSESLAAGVRVYVACIPLKLLLGIEILPAILLFVGLSLAYTYVGGVKAVIWTDAVQFGWFLLGGLYALCYVPQLVPGGWSAVLGEAAEGGRMAWFNPAFGLAKPFNIWMGLIGGTCITLSSHGAEQLIVQRVLACRNVRDGRRALLLSAALVLPLFLIFLLVGAMLWVYYRHVPLPIPLPEARPGIKSYDYVFPIFMLTAVPPVLKGFLIVAILSAAMSSVSSALTSLASVVTMDFVRGNARVVRPESFFLRLSKAATVFWAAVLVGVALWTRQVDSVLNAAFSLRGLTSGALLGGLGLAVFGRGVGWPATAVGMLGSVGAMIAIHLLWRDRLFWPWYTLLGTLLTVGVACTLAAARTRNTARRPR